MLIAELGQGRIEGNNFLPSLVMLQRVLSAGNTGKPIAGQLSFFNHQQPLPRKTPMLIDEQVIHHAGQPRARLVNLGQCVEFAIRLNEEFLKKILGLGFLPC